MDEFKRRREHDISAMESNNKIYKAFRKKCTKKDKNSAVFAKRKTTTQLITWHKNKIFIKNNGSGKYEMKHSIKVTTQHWSSKQEY